MIGKRIQVFWPSKKTYYKGTIVEKGDKRGTWNIEYDDEQDPEPIRETLEGPRKVEWQELDSKEYSSKSSEDQKDPWMKSQRLHGRM